MSVPILSWPAFADLKSFSSTKLPCEQGVWGKVPGAPTDYRWIARSPGLESKGLEEQISLGSEDQPVEAQLWLHEEGRYYATGLYPSQAGDASGRSGFLEKQVLAWTRPAKLPAALGALLLLERVATLNADTWWAERENPSWVNPDFSLQLAPEEIKPVQERLESCVEQGIEELEATIGDRKYLAALYEQILARRKPALLTGLTQPLSPRALAALLLPLPRPLADSLSLAGWIPSNRASFDKLGQRWDVIVLPPGLADQAPVQESTAETQGWALAAALLDREPSLAPHLLNEALSSENRKARPAPQPPAEPPLVLQGPSLSDLDALRPGARIPLPPPPERAPEYLRKIHIFACAVDSRWPDLEQWTRNPVSELQPLDDSLFSSWITLLEQQKPGHVHVDQWQIKLDVLRSAALVLNPKVRPRAGFPKEKGPIPALLFSLFVSPALLAEMDENLLRDALRHSLGCTPNPWNRKLQKKLAAWPVSGKKAPRVQALIKAVFEEAPQARS